MTAPSLCFSIVCEWQLLQIERVLHVMRLVVGRERDTPGVRSFMDLGMSVPSKPTHLQIVWTGIFFHGKIEVLPINDART